MLDIPAASLLHPHLNTRETSLNSHFAVAQVHVPNALGPVYAGKSFLNPIFQLKSVQYFPFTWKVQIHHAPVLRKPRALQSVLFNKTFCFQSVICQDGDCCCLCVDPSGKQQRRLFFFMLVLCGNYEAIPCGLSTHLRFKVLNLSWFEVERRAGRVTMDALQEAGDHRPYSHTLECACLRVCVHAYTNLANHHTHPPVITL